MNFTKKIKEREKTTLQKLAEKHNVSQEYVYWISRGLRKPVRGKGLEIYNDLKNMLNE
jgi:hypothetical protein